MHGEHQSFCINSIEYLYINNYSGMGILICVLQIIVIAGDSCTEDIDGCQDNPCTEHTNCTDLTPADQVAKNRAYECSECPEGYTDDDGTCVGSY